MGIFRPVVQPFVLPMFNRETFVFAGCPVRAEFVDDHHPWRHGALLQELAHQALSSFAVPAALDQDIKDKAVLIHSPP